MARANLDPRIASLQSWEKATKGDPFFMLTVKWPPAGLTIHQVMEAMLSLGYATSPITTSADLIPLLCASGPARTRTPLSHLGAVVMKALAHQ